MNKKTKILRSLASLLALLILVFSTAFRSLAYSEGVPGFVERCYQVAFGRLPDEAGFEYWQGILNEKKMSGTEVVKNFIFSPEYLSRNTSADTYVSDLYTMFMGRDPDPSGFDYWLSQMSSGASRDSIFNGFSGSEEFKNICASYGIEAISAPSQTPVEQFVIRLYKVVLHRDSDPQGLADWTGKLTRGEMSGTEVASNFFFSPEYLQNLVYIRQYVDDLYNALLGRQPDETGRQHWIDILKEPQYISNQLARYVFNSFAGSAEFASLCQSYGIDQGTAIPELLHGREEAVNWTMSQLGKGIDFDGGAGNQCVDLVFAYTDYLGSMLFGGHAYYFMDTTLPLHWCYVDSPAPGDIIVWDRNTKCSADTMTGNYGHVGIIVAVDGNTLTTVEQNAGYDYCVTKTRPANMAGRFIRPNFS